MLLLNLEKLIKNMVEKVVWNEEIEKSIKKENLLK